jgi:hypothetical protein
MPPRRFTAWGKENKMTKKGQLEKKLAELRENYKKYKGKPFVYFLCPITRKDEDVELIRGHLINEAIQVGGFYSRRWTVQRKDVDNFYGQIESKFVILQYSEDRIFQMIFMEKSGLRKNLNIKMIRDGVEIDFFFSPTHDPEQHVPVIMTDSDEIKTHKPSFILREKPEDIEKGFYSVDISRDLTLYAVASLIKAAHLIAFDIFGYYYALSSGGIEVARILAQFYEKSRKEPFDLDKEMRYFEQYKFMVAPVIFSESELQLSDEIDSLFLLLLDVKGEVWSVGIIIKIREIFHEIVFLPYLKTAENADTYNRFMLGNIPVISFQLAKFEDDTIKINPTVHQAQINTSPTP